MYVFIINVLLIVWALFTFGKYRTALSIRSVNIQKTLPTLKEYIWPSVLIGLTSGNWRHEFFNQSWLWRSQVWDYRRFLFSSSQAVFSFVWIFLCLALFLEVSSYVIVGIAFIFLFLSQITLLKNRSWTKWSNSVFYFAIGFLFLEFGFKNSGLLMQYLLESEVVFFTTIDSSLNLLGLLGLSAVAGFFIPVSGWSLIVTFLFFLNSQISFLGFAFVIVGEFIGTNAYWFWRVRSWDEKYKKRVSGLLVWIFAYLLLFILGIVGFRYFFSFGSAFNQLFILKWVYLATVFCFLAGLYGTIMTWGHFACLKVEKQDVAVSDSSLVKELAALDVDSISVFIKQQMKLRREKLLEFKKEFEVDPSSRSKIPPFVLNQFESELAIIDKMGL
jgi:hypothetical protein